MTKKTQSQAIKIALIGCPNVGKSSIINKLAKNAKLKVGNWPGATVTQTYTNVNINKKSCIITDLPGIYSLTSKSIEEKITLNNILNQNHDLYINVISPNDLNRGLNLSIQLKELNIPFITIINRTDLMGDDIRINEKLLELQLKSRIFLNSCKKGFSYEKLVEFIEEGIIESKKPQKKFYFYDEILVNLKQKITAELDSRTFFEFHGDNEINKNFFVIKLIEGNTHYYDHLKIEDIKSNVVKKIILDTELSLNQKSYQFLENKRALFIKNIISSSVKYMSDNSLNSKTVKFDRFLFKKKLILPFIAIVLLLSFVLVINFATPYKDLISDFFIVYLPNWFHLNNLNIWWESFIVNGFFAGIGTLLSFLPIMYMLFFILSILEESGFLSRISLAMETFFNKLGLSGKSLIPLVLGFGCNVSSIFATRVIKNQKQREATALISPFMSCSARFTVFALFSSLFFGSIAALIILSLYVISILFTIFMGLFLKWKYNLGSETTKDIIDLPLYNWPSMRNILGKTNVNIRGYIKTAMSVILFFVILVWFLSYMTIDGQPSNGKNSILSQLRYVFQPIFTPLGFGNSWILCVSLIPAIIAKEGTVASIAILANINNSSTTINNDFGHDVLHTLVNSFKYLLPNYWFNDEVFQAGHINNFNLNTLNLSTDVAHSRIQIYSFLIFVLLTIPCITTLAAIKKEFNWKIMWKSIGFGLLCPYLMSLIFYWIAMIFLLI